MKNYKYQAWDSLGMPQEGVKAAVSQEDVLVWLKEKGLTPVIVESMSKEKTLQKKIYLKKRARAGDLASLCWQLATMIEGGIPITEAIDTISLDFESPYLRDVLSKAAEKIKHGDTLYGAVKQFPDTFDTLFCSMILAGETGGALPDVLNRMAIFYEKRDQLKRKVRAALAYPIFVFGFVVLIVIVLMTFIIPRFQMIFKQIKSDLPLFTKMFMGVYDGIMNNIGWFFVLLVLSISGLWIWSRTEKGHRILSRFVLKMPLFGKLITQAFIVMFSRTLGTLLRSGVGVLDGFSILSKIIIKEKCF